MFAALQRLRAALPFRLLGIDSDNGSEFVNERLLRYCRREGLSFTRCRAYHKNGQAHVEERNGAVVRQTIGYDRYEGAAALYQLNRDYARVRVQANGVLPAMKLIGKERIGTRVRRRYDTPATPYRRALALGVVSAEDQAWFAAELAAEGPSHDGGGLTGRFASCGPCELGRPADGGRDAGHARAGASTILRLLLVRTRSSGARVYTSWTAGTYQKYRKTLR